jgi:hypothetical protein
MLASLFTRAAIPVYASFLCCGPVPFMRPDKAFLPPSMSQFLPDQPAASQWFPEVLASIYQ